MPKGKVKISWLYMIFLNWQGGLFWERVGKICCKVRKPSELPDFIQAGAGLHSPQGWLWWHWALLEGAELGVPFTWSLQGSVPGCATPLSLGTELISAFPHNLDLALSPIPFPQQQKFALCPP